MQTITSIASLLVAVGFVCMFVGLGSTAVRLFLAAGGLLFVPALLHQASESGLGRIVMIILGLAVVGVAVPLLFRVVFYSSIFRLARGRRAEAPGQERTRSNIRGGAPPGAPPGKSGKGSTSSPWVG